jgi:hypothetical protein
MTERELFEAALEVPPEDRAAYLDSVCGADAALRQRLERLLTKHDEANSFLEVPPAEFARTVNVPAIEQAGTQIGPYKLLEQIGEGGFGIVGSLGGGKLNALILGSTVSGGDSSAGKKRLPITWASCIFSSPSSLYEPRVFMDRLLSSGIQRPTNGVHLRGPMCISLMVNPMDFRSTVRSVRTLGLDLPQSGANNPQQTEQRSSLATPM